MIVSEKPALDDDLLLHYGVPGMRWGKQKAPDPLIGRRPAALPPPTIGRSRASAARTAPQHKGLSTGTKVAIGITGAAAAAYFLSKTGTRPSAQAMTSGSNRIGRKAVTSVLKTYGKVGAKSLKAAPKVVGTAGKATYNTTKFAGKTSGRVVKSVSRASSRSVANAYNKLKSTPVRRVNPVSGQRFGNLLLGNHGSQPVGLLGNFRQGRSNSAIRRLYSSSRP